MQTIKVLCHLSVTQPLHFDQGQNVTVTFITQLRCKTLLHAELLRFSRANQHNAECLAEIFMITINVCKVPKVMPYT